MNATRALGAAATAAAMILFAAPAAADGLPRGGARPDPYAHFLPDFAPVYSWSGVYVGGHAGGAHASADWIFSAPRENFDETATAFAGGAHAGAQLQWGRAVLGAEVAYTWADLEVTAGSGLTPGVSHTAALENLLLVTGKLGYAFERYHAYAKGGWASADVDIRSSVAATGVVTTSSSAREHGWTAGLGLEYAVTDAIILGVEYDYVKLNVDARTQLTPGGAVGGSVLDGGVDVQMLMARLSIKLGGR
jgi:outer membrane immunogenic protein